MAYQQAAQQRGPMAKVGRSQPGHRHGNVEQSCSGGLVKHADCADDIERPRAGRRNTGAFVHQNKIGRHGVTAPTAVHGELLHPAAPSGGKPPWYAPLALLTGAPYVGA